MSPNSQLMCFGNLVRLWTLCVILHFTVASLYISGQYVHLPNLVQCLGTICCLGASNGGMIEMHWLGYP